MSIQPTRHQARVTAVKVLYASEFYSDKSFQWLDFIPEVLGRELPDYTEIIIENIFDKLPEIDQKIRNAAKNWRLERMTLVDRNILRLALFEMNYGQSLNPAIVINEALELAKEFGSEDSSKFINGVLDATLKNSKTEKQ